MTITFWTWDPYWLIATLVMARVDVLAWRLYRKVSNA